MSTVLCTGFEPFGKFATNPSWDALQFAQREGLLAPGARIARIPVTWQGAFAALEAAVHDCQPAAILCFGLHGGISGRDADTIYLERMARNRDGASKADNDGILREPAPIEAGAPDTLAATLDFTPARDALMQHGFHAAFSDDAGAYLCNHLFYRGMRAFGLRFPFGFVHVPPVKELGGVLSIAELARAAGILSQQAVQQVQRVGNRR